MDQKISINNDQSDKLKDQVNSNNQNPTILIAEDNDVNMMLIKIMLENLLPTAILIEAANGKMAVEQFSKSNFDLLFMDIQMPEMNGYSAASEIRKIGTDKRVPIIALTAGTVTGEKERCLEAGMDDYMSKPILQNALKAMLDKWLGK